MKPIKIDKNIPIPTPRRTGLTDVIRKLKVGDSFLYDAKVKTGITTLSKRLKVKLALRKVNNKQVRIWRVK